MRWRCESRVDIIYKNYFIIDEMAKRGCQRVQYGIESDNQEVLDHIFKELDVSIVEEIIQYMISSGIHVAASFILGHYCDTKDKMQDTVDLMARLKK